MCLLHWAFCSGVGYWCVVELNLFNLLLLIVIFMSLLLVVLLLLLLLLQLYSAVTHIKTTCNNNNETATEQYINTNYIRSRKLKWVDGWVEWMKTIIKQYVCVCVHKRCFSKSTFTHYLFCFSCLKILLLVVFVIRYVDEFPQYQFIPPTPAIVIHVYVCVFI